RRGEWQKPRAAAPNPSLTHCHGRASTINARAVLRFVANSTAAGSTTPELTCAEIGSCAAISLRRSRARERTSGNGRRLVESRERTRHRANSPSAEKRHQAVREN